MELSLDLKKRYTYADYLTWADGKVRELFNGFIKLMSPAPRAKHQKTSTTIAARLFNLIEKNKGVCQVFHAPFDVRLPRNGETADDRIYTVVQPDVCVICDPAKIDDRGCLGAPDLAVEVQSLATAKYDLNDKFRLYEEVGVREYWVVFPYEKGILQFILQADGTYDQGTKYESGKIPVYIFDGEEIAIEAIFL
jgi:Uma2 family endonuclease